MQNCIEISPLPNLPDATLTVPGSKSLTNRALVLAALGEGKTILEGALWSEDTQLMVQALEKLGFAIEVSPDPTEDCNRVIAVQGRAGSIPNAGTSKEPLDLFVGNAGTVARFLSALVCLGHGFYLLHGTERMHQRPQAPLFRALAQLGYAIKTQDMRLPATICGRGPRPGTCEISMADSSQFASALLLAAPAGQWCVKVVDENKEESPYVFMTVELSSRFPPGSSPFRIEPDASSGSYFWGVNWLFAPPTGPAEPKVRVFRWPNSGWQIDAEFPKFWPLPGSVSRVSDLGDSIMTAIVLAPWATHPVTFTDLGRLRVQECERVSALRAELTKCGAKVTEEGDNLTVFPSHLHGARIETYHDHRMAMCFAMLGLRVADMHIVDPGCVRKTFPNFFQKLAAPPPAGLGASILSSQHKKVLSLDELISHEA